MKKLLIAGLALCAFACNNESTVDYALLSGTIKNPSNKGLTIFKGQEAIKSIIVNEDGSFADTLKVAPGFYTLSDGRERSSIFLEHGDNLTLSLDTKAFDETISYTGIGSENNNYLAAKLLANETREFNFQEVFSMDENAFLKEMNNLKDKELDALNKATNVSKTFKTFEEKNINYGHLTNLLSYQSAHEYFTKKDNFKPSEDFLKLLETVDYHNEADYKSIDNYKQLVQSYYMNKIDNSNTPSDVFKNINSKGFKQLKEDLANNLRYNITPNNPSNEALFNGIISISTDEALKKEITSKYNKTKALAKGMPSPKFVNYENHKGGTTSLDDLKGKYVYIDVWATWCGPCIREIPALKNIEEKYHDKNIAFVSTSIDRASAHNKWVKMVKDKALGGIQLMADKDWQSQFVKDYAIEGIPRFILVDPEGNIVSADAPRPSDPKLIQLFTELSI